MSITNTPGKVPESAGSAEAGASKFKRKYLGEVLVSSGLITSDILEQALAHSKARGIKLGRALMQMGILEDVQIAQALADQLAIPYINLEETEIPDKAIELISEELAKNYTLIPVSVTDAAITIAIANPLDFYAIDDVRFATQLRVNLRIAAELDILTAIDRYYSDSDYYREIALDADADQLSINDYSNYEEESDSHESGDLANKAPVVRFVNLIISDAIKHGASDVHIEPYVKAVKVRFRVDGIMREIISTGKTIHAGVVSRIKVMSKMDITVRRVPQDGKLKVNYQGTHYDLRISTLPTGFGEKVTIRLLNSRSVQHDIHTLGLPPTALKDVKAALGQPQGMILVTGPTGSGKSTTLYSCLQTLFKPSVSIITLENPIEYQVEGINQVEINIAQGLTFAKGLRSVLRQDPDIIMVGEIRDQETAEIAFHAAQTGHLVLSTLHTNNAFATVSRLLDMNIEPFNINSALIMVISQRLVRRLCEHCKSEDELSPRIIAELPKAYSSRQYRKFWKAGSCDKCGFTGYNGRLAIFEVLRITTEIQDQIAARVPLYEMQRSALERNFLPITLDGLDKAAQGLTTVAEVYRMAPSRIDDLVEESTPEENEQEELNLLTQNATLFKKEGIQNQSAPRILIVEENEFMVQLLQGIVQGEGYVEEVCRNTEDALRYISQAKPNLVITALLSPNIEGLELIGKLRANLGTAYIPVMVISTTDERDTEIEAIEAGADDFMVKPINARRFVAGMNRLLKGFRNSASGPEVAE
jgi:type IV pilus assembly protein PilB